jgi:hypothetical protein
VKRNFNVVLTDPDGRPHVKKVFKVDGAGMPVLEQRSDGGKVQEFDRFDPKTMRDYAIDALAGRWAGEDRAPWDQVKKRGALLDRLMFEPSGAIELDNADVQIIKDALEHQGASYHVMYRIGTMLDTDPKPTEAPVPDAAPAAQ